MIGDFKIQNTSMNKVTNKKTLKEIIHTSVYIYIYIYIYIWAHIKYMYTYIHTNNLIYFKYLGRRFSNWTAFHKRTFREGNWQEIFRKWVKSVQFISVSLQESFHHKWLQFKEGREIMLLKKEYLNYMFHKEEESPRKKRLSYW